MWRNTQKPLNRAFEAAAWLFCHCCLSVSIQLKKTAKKDSFLALILNLKIVFNR
jgi:hypothetical protein